MLSRPAIVVLVSVASAFPVSGAMAEHVGASAPRLPARSGVATPPPSPTAHHAPISRVQAWRQLRHDERIVRDEAFRDGRVTTFEARRLDRAFDSHAVRVDGSQDRARSSWNTFRSGYEVHIANEPR